MQKLPKYVEIEEYYKDKIENGIIPAGALFPPENEISLQFSASHMTITKAMNELSSKGYVKRIPGKGTFASDDYKAVIKKPLFKSNSISAQILASGMTPKTELYKYSIIKGKEIPNVAKKMNIEPDKIDTFLSAYSKSLSLESSLNNDENKDMTLAEIIRDENASVEEEIEYEGLKNDIYNIVSRLKDREQEVVKMRFGLGNTAKKTLEEIGNLYGVTKECIRQTEMRALKKMKATGAELLACYVC